MRASSHDIHQALLPWYDVERRQLPWRDTRDPYAIWISEIMAQQTRVDTVVPYYLRWLERFPDIATLARASEDDVFALWQGLGYYSRARNLLRAARHVRDVFHGRLPESTEALRTLPGVGRYTAGAIASIAFGQVTPVVDGNVIRVFARLFDVDDDVRTAATQRSLWETARELVPAERPGDFNQALMELGALVCTPRNPRCAECPLFAQCRGRHRADSLPFKSPAAAPRAEHHFAFGAFDPSGRVLVGKNPAGSLLGGMWQYPMTAASDAPGPAFRRETGLVPRDQLVLADITHVFSHIRMRVTPIALRIDSAGAPVKLHSYADAAWMYPDELEALGRSTLVRKLATRFVSAQLAIV